VSRLLAVEDRLFEETTRHLRGPRSGEVSVLVSGQPAYADGRWKVAFYWPVQDNVKRFEYVSASQLDLSWWAALQFAYEAWRLHVGPLCSTARFTSVTVERLST